MYIVVTFLDRFGFIAFRLTIHVHFNHTDNQQKTEKVRNPYYQHYHQQDLQ